MSHTHSVALLFFSHMNSQELGGNSLNAFFNSLQPQLFGSRCEQTAVETQQGGKDWIACAVVQYGFNTVLKLAKTFWTVAVLQWRDTLEEITLHYSLLHLKFCKHFADRNPPALTENPKILI